MRAHFDYGTNLNLKAIDHIDGSPAIRQITSRKLADVKVHECWRGPARWNCGPTPRRRCSDCRWSSRSKAFYWRADFTLVTGEIIHDYLAKSA